MKLSSKQLFDFQVIYKEVFGETISEVVAHKKALSLIQFVKLIYQPIRKDEYERVKKEFIKIEERVHKKMKL